MPRHRAPGAGRKPRIAGELSTQLVRFLVTPSEAARLERRASELGTTVAERARDLALSDAPSITEDPEALRRALAHSVAAVASEDHEIPS